MLHSIHILRYETTYFPPSLLSFVNKYLLSAEHILGNVVCFERFKKNESWLAFRFRQYDASAFYPNPPAIYN